MEIKRDMKRFLLLFVLFVLVNFVAAQTEPVDEAVDQVNEDAAENIDEDTGITPDSFLWGLDKAIDQLSLLLTFDEGKKARKGLEIARERLIEVKAMAEENKFEHAEKAREEHGKVLSRVKQNIESIERDNSEDEIKEVIEIENEVELYDDEVEQTFDELKIKIEIKGEITDQQKEMIDSILDSLKGQTGEIEIEIKNKKDKTKIKIKQETKKDEAEIEEDVEDIEESIEEKRKEGLEKALELRIDHIEREIEKSEDYLDEHNKEELKKHLELAKEVLDEAEDAVDNGEFEHAKELILRALRLAVSVRGEVRGENLEVEEKTELRNRLREKIENREEIEDVEDDEDETEDEDESEDQEKVEIKVIEAELGERLNEEEVKLNEEADQ